jgi:hypothetical protein
MEFGARVEFLSYVLTPDRTEMAEDKLDTIKEWQVPRSLRDIECVLGCPNFYEIY